MSTATLKRKSDMPQLVLEGILLDCGVPLCYWSEWFDLVYYRGAALRCGANV